MDLDGSKPTCVSRSAWSSKVCEAANRCYTQSTSIPIAAPGVDRGTRGPACQKTTHNGKQKNCIGQLCTRRIEVDQFAQLNGLTTSPLRAHSLIVPMIPLLSRPSIPS